MLSIEKENFFFANCKISDVNHVVSRTISEKNTRLPFLFKKKAKTKQNKTKQNNKKPSYKGGC